MYNIIHWRQRAPKHVVMVSKHCCIRVMKQAHALRLKGWRVDSLSMRRPSDLSAFDYSYCVSDLTKYTRALNESGAPIIHVHNEPDRLMRVADKAAKGRPVVYDCHDLESNRAGSVTADELFAFSRADGVISVSAAHRDVAYALHPWDVPSAVVYSLPLRKWQPTPTGERSGVVYQGGLLAPGRCSWRDLSVPTAEFWQAGIDFDIYTSPDMSRYYPRVQGFVQYGALLRSLTKYDYGFCGHDPAHPVYESAMPNKVWEYAMCGVIPLLVNLPHAAEVFGSGIVATSTQDAIAQMQECDAESMRADVLAHARFMDEEIENTIALYEELL